MAAGRPVFHDVVREFGEGILGPDGEIDRKRLGGLVFADVGRRARLNELVHPAVRAALLDWLGELSGALMAAAIIPLLYESGMTEDWDKVVCVTASASLQHERLRERGLSNDEAAARMAAQLPTSGKEEMADYVIVNNGSRELLREQTLRVWRSIRES
jgi:dephospho-CoA kinase